MCFRFASLKHVRFPSLAASLSVEKIPYIGRVRVKIPADAGEKWAGHDEYGDHTPGGDPNNPYNRKGWESFYSEPGLIKFGDVDLVIQGTLDNCSSTLESSYGCSFRKPIDPSTVLAGRKTFSIDELEVFFVHENHQ